jgi:hypothetical protein
MDIMRSVMRVVGSEREHTPRAKALLPLMRVGRAKAKALAYLEAKATARTTAKGKCGDSSLRSE